MSLKTASTIHTISLSGDNIEDAPEDTLWQDSERVLLRPNQVNIPRAGCWGICSATALYTTKKLLTTHEYPLTLSFHSFLAIFIAYAIVSYLSSIILTTKEARLVRWISQGPWPDAIWPDTRWCTMIPAAVAAAASLPMLFEGLLHTHSMPVLIMLYRALPWELIVVLGACGMVLYHEYRLMIPGLIWGVSGIILIGVARAMFVIGFKRSGTEDAKLTSSHGFVVLTTVFGMFFSAGAAWKFEFVSKAYSCSTTTLPIMSLNIISIVGTAFTGTSFLVYSPLTAGSSTFTNMPISTTAYLTSSISNTLVLFAAIQFGPAAVVSWTQAFFFSLASIILIGVGQIQCAINLTQLKINRMLRVPAPESRDASPLVSPAAALTLILTASWIISTLSLYTIDSIPPSFQTQLDTEYMAASTFDIVVSMYDENPFSVRKMLDSILATNYISNLTPNIIIYTKNQHASIVDLTNVTDATKVTLLPNIGREGGTYLHHIVHNWDKLAKQTLFIQAHAHNMREIIPRINSYLVPETGMLSLGFTGVQCSCHSCSDRHSWTDSYNIVPSLYSKIHNQECDTETPILLSYKGQFIASGKRIRGLKREIYEGLLQVVEGKENWSHEKGALGEESDTPDNPLFGFTLERVWGLLMQCATDGSVAAKCPSLLSGMAHGGSIEDCQCLDEAYKRPPKSWDY